MRGKSLWMDVVLSLTMSAAAAAPAAAQTPAPAAPVPAAPVPAPPTTGGAAYGVVFQPTVPGLVAQASTASPTRPTRRPPPVKHAIWAAN